MVNKINETKLETIIFQVKTEFITASSKYGAFNSAHEGMSILREELDELWESVKLKQNDPHRVGKIREEATHVATMALRMLYDCVYGGKI